MESEELWGRTTRRREEEGKSERGCERVERGRLEKNEEGEETGSGRERGRKEVRQRKRRDVEEEVEK